MSKRPRSALVRSDSGLERAYKRRQHFHVCLSDGVSEQAIENFAKNRATLRQLLTQLQNNELTTLKTSGVTNPVINEISQILPKCKLERLVLVQGEKITAPSIQFLMRAITSCSLSHLDLRDNALDEASLNHIWTNLPLTEVSSLNIGSNAANIQCILNIPQTCPSVTKLYLDSNHFTDITVIGKNVFPLLPSLSYLSLVDCHIDGRGLRSIIPFLRRHGNLAVLHLSCNPLRGPEGIQATCDLIIASIALQEIHLIGNNYTEEEKQSIINALASRKDNGLRVFPSQLTKRANYMKRIYPGKEEVRSFLQDNNLEGHSELFFRFEITMDTLKQNEYLLSSLEKYQLDRKEIGVIENAIELALSHCRTRRRSNTTENYERKQLMEHLLIVDVQCTSSSESTSPSPVDMDVDVGALKLELYWKGTWVGTFPVRVRSFFFQDACTFYQLQAAGNRLFRLRHPFILDFLGMYLPHSTQMSRVFQLNMVFEDIAATSLKKWLIDGKGNEHFAGPRYVRYLVRLCREVAQGMEYICGQQKMSHFELKLDRVALCYVEGEVIPKILDFGLDCFVDGDSHVEEARWCAPEGKSKQSDVWMFAIFMWELFTTAYYCIEKQQFSEEKLLPFNEISLEDITPMVMAGAKLNHPGKCPPEIYAIICDATNPTPSKRPAFSFLTEALIGLEKKFSLNRSTRAFSLPQPDRSEEWKDFGLEAYSVTEW